jgi:hypothetical protein
VVGPPTAFLSGIQMGAETQRKSAVMARRGPVGSRLVIDRARIVGPGSG